MGSDRALGVVRLRDEADRELDARRIGRREGRSRVRSRIQSVIDPEQDRAGQELRRTPVSRSPVRAVPPSPPPRPARRRPRSLSRRRRVAVGREIDDGGWSWVREQHVPRQIAMDHLRRRRHWPQQRREAGDMRRTDIRVQRDLAPGRPVRHRPRVVATEERRARDRRNGPMQAVADLDDVQPTPGLWLPSQTLTPSSRPRRTFRGATVAAPRSGAARHWHRRAPRAARPGLPHRCRRAHDEAAHPPREPSAPAKRPAGRLRRRHAGARAGRDERAGHAHAGARGTRVGLRSGSPGRAG